MLRNIRLAGIQLALAAMVLRALLPAGWMPDAAAPSGMAICSMDGPVSLATDKADLAGKQSPAGGDAHHVDACPFASAPHAATFSPAIASLAPAAAVLFAPAILQSNVLISEHGYTPQSPRAPPAFV